MSEKTMADCDCLIPYLEGVGQHSPGCSIFNDDPAPVLTDSDEPAAKTERAASEPVTQKDLASGVLEKE